jgi:hypothetical protein
MSTQQTNIHALSDPSKLEMLHTYKYALDRMAIGIDPNRFVSFGKKTSAVTIHLAPAYVASLRCVNVHRACSFVNGQSLGIEPKFDGIYRHNQITEFYSTGKLNLLAPEF